MLRSFPLRPRWEALLVAAFTVLMVADMWWRHSPFSLVSMLLISVFLGLWVIRTPRRAVLCFVALLPLEGLGALIGFPAFSPIRLVGLLALATFVLHRLRDRRPLLLPGGAAVVTLLVYLGVQSYWAFDQSLHMQLLGTVLQLILTVYLVLNSFTPDNVTSLVWVLVFVAALQGGYGLFQTATGSKLIIPGFQGSELSKFYHAGAYLRATGTLVDPNYFALNQLMSLPLTLFLARKASHTYTRVVLFIVAVVVGASVIVSFSRGALLAFGAFLLLLSVSRGRQRFTGVVVLCLFAMIVWYFRDAFIDRLHLYQEDARVFILTAFFREGLSSHTIFGVGLGSFRYIMADTSWGEASSSHNLFVEVLGELGLVGCTLLAWVFLSATPRSSRGLTPSDLSSALRQVLILFALSSLFVATTFVKIVYVVLGMVLVMNRRSAEADRLLKSA